MSRAGLNQQSGSLGKCFPIGIQFWMGLALWLVAAQVSAAPALVATLDRNTIPAGESLTLNLTFQEVLPTVAPQLPPMPNIVVSPNVGQSSQTSIANGRRSDSLVLTYTLTPTVPGDMVIPAISAQAGGRVLTSQPIPLKVLPAGAAANPAMALTNLAFLRLVVPKTEVYIGEPFPVEMHLYWQDARDIRMPQLRAEGFALGQMPKPTQTRTQVGNNIYNLAVFKLTATAARTGTLTLGPADLALTILIPMTNQRRSRDPFESFFGGPQYQQRPTTLASEAIALRVLPLPTEHVPEGFSGAIGSYQLAVMAGPTNVGVGDPITVRMQISGTGPLDALTMPPQPQWRDFNTYPATSTLETSDELGLVGVKKFEQVIIPQNHELKELPPVRFSFFDPAAKSYRTVLGPAFPLTVRPTGVATPPPSLANSNQGPAPAADDILHIKPRLEVASAAAPLLLAQPWFLALQGIPALAWLTLLVWRKRSESLTNNPRLRRQREVAQRVRDGLKELRTHAEARQSDQFFATLFRLLQEQLGERLDLPASAITEAVIDEKLRTRGLSEHATKGLHELFQTCNFARYSPVQSSQELSALIPKLEATLRDLQQLKA